MLRYEIAKRKDKDKKHLLGKGSYGKVYLGINKNTSEEVAIKKIVYNNDYLKELVGVYREAAILRHFNHPNIISLEDIEVDIDEHTTYLILPRMDTDLHAIIHHPMEDDHPQALSHEHIASIMYQLTSAVGHLHSHDVIHRDIKPENILVGASSCHIKLTDFGSARWLSSNRALTWNRTTVAYCAPEILLHTTYGLKADVWSLGAILGELLLHNQFLWAGKGKSRSEQISYIFQIVGERLPEQYTWIDNSKGLNFIENLCNQYKNNKRYPLEQRFRHANPLELKLLKNMLEFNPTQRTTAEEALSYFPFNYASEAGRLLVRFKSSSSAKEDERSWERYQDFERELDAKGENKYPDEKWDNILASGSVEELLQKEVKTTPLTHEKASPASEAENSSAQRPASPSQTSRGTLFHHESLTSNGMRDTTPKEKQKTAEISQAKASANEEEKLTAAACSPK